jgi:hypothetical protein
MMPFLAFFDRTVKSYGGFKFAVTGDPKNKTAKG